MDKIPSLLADPAWLFTTVFVGLLLGIFSNLVSDVLSRIGGRVSKKQHEKNEKEKQRIDADARKCVAHPLYYSLAMASTGISPLAEWSLATIGIVTAFLGLFSSSPWARSALLAQVATQGPIPAIQSFLATTFPNLVIPVSTDDAFTVATGLCLIVSLAAVVVIWRSVLRSGYWSKVAKRAKQMLDEQFSGTIPQTD